MTIVKIIITKIPV